MLASLSGDAEVLIPGLVCVGGMCMPMMTGARRGTALADDQVARQPGELPVVAQGRTERIAALEAEVARLRGERRQPQP